MARATLKNHIICRSATLKQVHLAELESPKYCPNIYVFNFADQFKYKKNNNKKLGVAKCVLWSESAKHYKVYNVYLPSLDIFLW